MEGAVVIRADRRVVLAAEAGSAAAARRHLHRVLGELTAPGDVPEAVVADAEVCLSELVTNAVLHAGTFITVTVTLSVTVQVTPETLRLQVGDGSSVEPQWVPRSLTAATGRGLLLITALSTARGVQLHPDGSGKTTWCELSLTAGGRRDQAAAASNSDADADADADADPDADAGGVEAMDALLAAEWASVVDELYRDGLDTPSPAPSNAKNKGKAKDEKAQLRLLRYPLRRGVRMREHREAVLRELRLLTLTHAISDPATARRTAEVSEILASEYAGHLTSAQVRVLQALAAGNESTDLNYPQLPDHEQLLQQWKAGMENLEQLNAETGVATLATPPDVRELTQWMLEEFTRQLTGLPPRPWAGALD